MFQSGIAGMSCVETMLDDPHTSYTFEAKPLFKDSFKTLYEFYESGNVPYCMFFNVIICNNMGGEVGEKQKGDARSDAFWNPCLTP